MVVLCHLISLQFLVLLFLHLVLYLVIYFKVSHSLPGAYYPVCVYTLLESIGGDLLLIYQIAILVLGKSFKAT